MRLSMVLVSSALAIGCGARTLPPREAPSKEVAREVVSPGPPQEGKGRILFDSPDGPVRVDVVTEANPRSVWIMTESHDIGRYRYETWELKPESDVVLIPICQTPCIADLPRGEHLVRYQTLGRDGGQSDVEHVKVTEEPTVHRRALGRVPSITNELLSILLQPILWAPGLTFGGVAVATGVQSAGADGTRAERLQTTSIGFGVSGAIFLAAGIVIGQWIRPTEQEGATTRFPLEERR
jgi:hypothetical protein